MPDPMHGIVEWVVPKVDAWQTYRDNEHAERWREYYRLWRGWFFQCRG